jgi:hypothetical protein
MAITIVSVQLSEGRDAARAFTGIRRARADAVAAVYGKSTALILSTGGACWMKGSGAG